MIISILSGKGGTGKTTVATSLFTAMDDAVYIDCDVEEPNGHLFLKPQILNEDIVKVKIPQIDDNECTNCGQCIEACQFNALVKLKNEVMVLSKLCHSCGACQFACTTKALTETERRVGVIQEGLVEGKRFYQGLLDLGEPMPVPVIKQLIDRSRQLNEQNIIIDCPPGTSCSVISSIEKSDYCLLVTEPSTFGLHDLKLAVELVRLLKVPCGVVVNKAVPGNSIIKDYVNKAGLSIVLELPYVKKVAQIYSEGNLINHRIAEWDTAFSKLGDRIRGKYHEAISSC